MTTPVKPIPAKPLGEMTQEERQAHYNRMRDYQRAVDIQNEERAKKAARTRAERDRVHRELTVVYGRDVIALIHEHCGPEVKTRVIEGGTFRPFGYTTAFHSGDRFRTSDTYKWGAVSIYLRHGSEDELLDMALLFRNRLKRQGITATPTGDEESHGIYLAPPRGDELAWTCSLEVGLAQVAEKAGTKEPKPAQ